MSATAAGGAGLRVKAVAKAGSKVVGTATGAAGTELRVPVPNAKLWSPDSPFLYDLQVTLLDGGDKAVDSVGSYFGMRQIGTARGADGSCASPSTAGSCSTWPTSTRASGPTGSTPHRPTTP
ncbi:hypothetical protein [Dactylosporangium darangshiense]|uniref:hypothetical protein n=1 Tax=Dactylosporangium darangshiense TaxID=579108 RepID=UPI0036304FA8